MSSNRKMIQKGIQSMMRRPTDKIVNTVHYRICVECKHHAEYRGRATDEEVERELEAIADYLLDEGFFTDEEDYDV